MKNKKSFTAVHMLIFLVIGAFVLIVLAVIVPNLLKKGSEETSDLLSSSRDYDDDGVVDFFDDCACEAGDEENDGCPPSPTITKEDCRDMIKEAYT